MMQLAVFKIEESYLAVIFEKRSISPPGMLRRRWFTRCWMDFVAIRCWAWSDGTRAKISTSFMIEATISWLKDSQKAGLPTGAPKIRTPSFVMGIPSGSDASLVASSIGFGE